jgi:hypothetical protein
VSLDDIQDEGSFASAVGAVHEDVALAAQQGLKEVQLVLFLCPLV